MPVQLGEFSFDPVEPTDFRISIEGSSKTGKSNSLAVLLEDLADVDIPTLVIERLGILTTVRKEDDDIVVVGARDEEGIDLAVPLGQLDAVVDMVLEQGMKVILDISTYSDLENGLHTEHKAAAEVLKGLNNRAQARLRSGRRRKCLVVIDEVHVLAPESNAPHINLDKYVKRVRAQIVKIATEGGNKGINLVTAYQRRSYTSKGVVSQVDNYVIHRLRATDRGDVAKEIGVDKEEIEALGTGEVLVYGDITRQRVKGPLNIRKRRSPDPREETFELPEPPEDLSDTLQEIADRIETKQERERERRSRVEQLESEVEELREENEELQKEADVADALRKVLERVQSGNGVPPDVAEKAERFEDLKEARRQLQGKIEDLETENQVLREELEAREAEIDDLEAEVQELEQLELVKGEVESNARTILRQIGASDPELEEAREELSGLRKEVKELRKERNRLKEAVDRAEESGGTVDEEFQDLKEMLKHEEVQKAVSKASDMQSMKEEHFWDAILALNDIGETTRKELGNHALIGVKHSSLGSILSGLKKVGIVKSSREGVKHFYELDVDNVKSLIRNHRHRQELKKRREQLEK